MRDYLKVRGMWGIRKRRKSRPVVIGFAVLLSVVPWCRAGNTQAIEPSGDEILAKVAESTLNEQAVAYSGMREYTLRNHRFGKEATVSVRMIYDPTEGKQFTVVQQSGTPRLLEIIEKLLASEADASRPPKRSDYEISPVNYRSCLRGTETISDRMCYVICLIPKHKSKYLIKGTAWIDRNSYGIVRLEGVTSASVSMWIGEPHFTQEFGQFTGFWLPIHTGSASSSLLLGASELEIRYMNYFVVNLRHSISTLAEESGQQPRP